MDSRKLERILILILALLNVFLLAVVLSDSAQARRSSAETAAALNALLEENGITAAEGAVRISPAPPKCTLTRDLTQELRLMKQLVGNCQPIDQGGNIWFYAGSKGQAVLRGSGEMDTLFEGSVVSSRGGPERTAMRLMRRCGIRTVAADAPANGTETVALCPTLEGIPVYNVVMRFRFMDGRLYMLNGTRIFDVVEKEESEGLLDSVTVLIRFLEIVRDEGYICSRIESLTPGYVQTVTRSGVAELTPVWRIETDVGALMIDADSGKAEGRLS